MRTCSVEGCEREHNALGLCGMHWRKARRHGIERLAKDYVERLAAEGLKPERDPMIGPPGEGCRVEGCENPHHGRGVCKTHYHVARHREQRRWAREQRAYLAAQEAES